MFFDAALPELIARALLLSSIAVMSVIVIVRVVGLRAFSKMTAFDFVVTVATGSLLAGASQATSWAEFVQPVLAIAALLGAQFTVARLRIWSGFLRSATQNTPVLLMRDGEVIHEALQKTRVTETDLRAKLREANVMDFSEVRAVVLETTGDVSVLHGDDLSETLLDGVRDLRGHR